jgi:DNA-binding beta-propeller fold protein YncE
MMRYAVLAFTSVILVSGVAAKSAAASPRQHVVSHKHSGWMTPRANPKHAWLYVAGQNQSVVAIYDLEEIGAPQIGAITNGINTPFGLALDAQGTLYVANPSGTVTIYPADATSPSLTLSQGLISPVGIAVDTNNDVYVGNQGSAPSIQVYAQGQTSPYRTITSPLIVHPGPITFDTHRNLFIVDNNNGIAEMPFGSQNLTWLGLQGLGYPSAIAVDPFNGNLYVSDISSKHDTLIFLPGQTQASAKMKGVSADFFAIGKIRRTTYLFGPCSPCNNMDVVKFPRKVLAVLGSQTFPQGVAIKPAGVP